jgi:RNA polymerase sigma-70 factor (ECF subfamily)
MPVVAEHETLPVAEARAGDPGAWDILFKRYQLPLYVYAVELVHDEQAGLDIVQETFISASRHIGSLRDDARFGGWLFGIAHQKCIQRWRKETREAALREELAMESVEPEPDPGELVMREEQEAEYMKCLNELPDAQRAVLLLHCLEEFPIAEIAGITGVSVGTVKSRLHYARRALRRLLEGEPTP